MKTVLIADDEKNIRTSLGVAFRLDGYEVRTVENGRQALEAVERGGIDLIVLDLQMPELDGMETLRELRRREHGVPVMILTAHGTVETAVEATRLGAFDFVEKPPHAEKILLTARNALRQASLEDENRRLREEFESDRDMIGSSPPMRRLFEQIRRVAPTQARVLILGENGTGKELIARALHRYSSRAEGPFVRVNCAAIPRDLFESELFGHEKGAFTGATARRRGKFVRADGGTALLDEIGEIPFELQSKILRVLESGELEPVGSDAEVEVDVRVLAATNRDIEKEVEEGRFREDLYYRLKVVTLEAPPLRERKDDIPALVDHFLERACEENNLKGKALDPGAVALLAAHDYPGNVRELGNLIERLVILSPGDTLGEEEVRDALPARRPSSRAPETAAGRPLREVMEELERQVIRGALERNGWRMAATARDLGLERSHLYKKVRALGIERPE
jgi:DNA-binding NtrC family response regulator